MGWASSAPMKECSDTPSSPTMAFYEQSQTGQVIPTCRPARRRCHWTTHHLQPSTFASRRDGRQYGEVHLRLCARHGLLCRNRLGNQERRGRVLRQGFDLVPPPRVHRLGRMPPGPAVREPLGEEETVAKGISGIVLALILAVPYLAEAECAWVVWSNYQTVTEFRPQADGSQKVMTDVSNRWEFERAFPSYKDCNWWVGELMKDLK